MLLGAISKENMFEGGFLIRDPYFNPGYRVSIPKKELREFDVKGHKIMAYSRKDAIKRLNHKKI